MQNQERPKPTLVSKNDVPKISETESALRNEGLIAEYECGIESRPEWCIWGNDGNGAMAVLLWIRPSQESEMVARRIAKYLKNQGAEVGVEMTEWNSNLQGKPIYAQVPPVEPKKIELPR